MKRKDFQMDEQPNGGQSPRALNESVDYMTRANSLYNPLLPKPGIFLVGDQGMEFIAKSGSGFIQIPWSAVKAVRAQLFFGGRYVRGFFVDTVDDQTLEFVVSDGKNCLRAMYKYLSREKLTAVKGQLTQLFKRKPK